MARKSGPARTSPYWLAWLATIAFFAGFYALLVPLPRYLGAVGLPDWQIGLVLGAFGVASLVGRPIAGVASDRFGSRRIMLVGAASLVLGALGVAATVDVVVLFALRLLQAIGYVAFTTAGTALVVSLVVPEERARRLAVFGAGANIAIALTPAAIAALIEVTRVEVGLFAAAAFAALGGLLALLLPGAAANSESRNARPIAWAVPRRLWLPMLSAALLGAAYAAFFQFAPILAERRAVAPGLLYTIYGASAAFYVAFDLGIGLGSWLFGVALQLAGLAGLYWTAAALAAAVVPFAPLLNTAEVARRGRYTGVGSTGARAGQGRTRQ